MTASPFDKWPSVAAAVTDVLREMAEREPGEWFDPTDARWWAECPQIGDLDPCACAELFAHPFLATDERADA